MTAFQIRSAGPHSTPLLGSVQVEGAKNSALKLMAAALLAPGTTRIGNVPRISDVEVMAQLLEQLGCTVHLEWPTVVIDVPAQLHHEAPYELVRRLRASIAVLGPLVARCGRASVALPGGDAIGSRGLDMHIAGLGELGARLHIEHGQVVATVPEKLTGATMTLNFPSVGATENLVMAAVLARGESIIDNAAREPEIMDLCHMLVAMGAQIEGIGTPSLHIQGVDHLNPVDYQTVPDRIVAGTWAYAAAIAGGQVSIINGQAHHLEVVLHKLTQAGADVAVEANGFTITVPYRLRSVDVVTLPYPGFPTDLQPFAMTLAALSEGSAMITENVFEARFMFAQELARLGAQLHIDGHHAVVRGVSQLSGAPVLAHDIRAGAALVLAGLAAEGTTTVSHAYHVDRGYPDFADKLAGLGADVVRIDEKS